MIAVTRKDATDRDTLADRLILTGALLLLIPCGLALLALVFYLGPVVYYNLFVQ
jgi:hypothetical protein